MHRLKPMVSRHWLFALAGVMWSAVGLMLIWRAINWLAAMPLSWGVSIGLSGAGLGLLAYYFMFTKTAARNIRRLYALPDRVCIFAFNSPKGYAVIVFMIALGVALRHSSLPRWLLAVLYAAMGGALLLASFRFYEHVRPMSIPSGQKDGI
ncbi:MAG: hypothetical protein GXP42_14150 [Chloroflexi bacterium]|nr:hypothetical protein [Chloroflexota bacterium]